MLELSDLMLKLHAYGPTAKIFLSTKYAWLSGAVVAAFTFINSLRVLAYVPQIVAAAKDSNGASGISYSTWALFLVSHLTTIAYAIVQLGDAVLALLFLGNAAACVVVITITLVKRRRHVRPNCAL